MKKGSPLHDPLFTMAEAQALSAATETIFLGLLDGAPRFGHGTRTANGGSAEIARRACM